jgi:hypothetical protein
MECRKFKGSSLCQISNGLFESDAWWLPATLGVKLQTEISLSTTEAKYIALSQAMRELIPMRAFLEEIGKKLQLEFCNNVTLYYL